MDFKFDFLSTETKEDNPDVEALPSETLEEFPVEEIKFQSIVHQKDDPPLTYTQIALEDGTIIKYLQPDAAHRVEAVDDHTDLVPGIYEGGRKTWECSYLLLDYLCEKYADSFKDKQVLELGCGSALPALYCLQNGACVTFQDYNKDVIKEVTVPNVKLTCSGDEDQLSKCTFFAGDWRCFNKLMVERHYKYEIILTSETIYSCSSYGKLHDIFSACLLDDGAVYVATKYHYFGVGGGVESFKQHVTSQGVFNVETISTTEENLQCSILKLTKKPVNKTGD